MEANETKRDKYLRAHEALSCIRLSDFQYSDAGFCVIEQRIEDVCEKSFIQLMNELIFEDLLMKNSTLEYTIPM